MQGITLIEEDIGAVSTILAKQLGNYGSSVGKKVCFLTITEKSEPIQKKELIGVRNSGQSQVEEEGNFLEQSTVALKAGPFLSLEELDFDLVIFESFSTYLFGRTDREIVGLMDEMRRLAGLGRAFVLTADVPMFTSIVLSYIRSRADNILIIRTELTTDKISRLLYIPKMKDAKPMERLVKFTIEEEGIQIDTREFVG
jgi:KaiC/GvpD/RAD55 family RecA-like ATPase